MIHAQLLLTLLETLFDRPAQCGSTLELPKRYALRRVAQRILQLPVGILAYEKPALRPRRTVTRGNHSQPRYLRHDRPLCPLGQLHPSPRHIRILGDLGHRERIARDHPRFCRPFASAAEASNPQPRLVRPHPRVRFHVREKPLLPAMELIVSHIQIQQDFLGSPRVALQE